MRTAVFALAFLAAACGSATTETAAPVAEAANLAEPWFLDAGQSRIAFVSIKADEIAETHTFTSLEGEVAPDGEAVVTIDLDSVETGVDIRNSRMREMLFETAMFANATVSARVPLDSFAELAAGARMRQSLPVTLSVHGMEAEIETDVFVTRLSPTAVLVETASPVLVNAFDFGLGEGVDRLRDVAGLPSISPAVPVTASFVFTQG